MTTTTQTINRYREFHHHRHSFPSFYLHFEQHALALLAESGSKVWRVQSFFAELYTRGVSTTINFENGKLEVRKPLLVWLRRNHPNTCEGRFGGSRRYEASRKKGNVKNWQKLALRNVTREQVGKLLVALTTGGVHTSMPLLKERAGVTFNQNYNATVLRILRIVSEEARRLLPVTRPRVR